MVVRKGHILCAENWKTTEVNVYLESGTSVLVTLCEQNILSILSRICKDVQTRQSLSGASAGWDGRVVAVGVRSEKNRRTKAEESTQLLLVGTAS